MEQTTPKALHGPEEFYEEVYSIVGMIPPGKVLTYGAIARLTGRPRHARLVGASAAKHPVRPRDSLSSRGEQSGRYRSRLGASTGDAGRRRRPLRPERMRRIKPVSVAAGKRICPPLIHKRTTTYP